MAVALSFQFVAGRYHATPWDKQTNEESVEWPPSPWRILRSLVATAYRSDCNPTRKDLADLVTKLGATLPQYLLPPYVKKSVLCIATALYCYIKVNCQNFLVGKVGKVGQI